MTDQQIEKAAGEYAAKTAEQYEVCNSEFVQEIMVAFERGAQYSLSHQWVSVEDALPEDDNLVLAHFADIDPLLCYAAAYYQDGEWQTPDDFYYDCKIDYWMEIPKLNPEKKKDERKRRCRSHESRRQQKM